MKKPLLQQAVLPLLVALFPGCGKSFTTSGEPSGTTSSNTGGTGGESTSASGSGGSNSGGNGTGGSTTVQQCDEEANKCTGGKTCQEGVCLCPAGLDDCNGTCVDTESDEAHCGGCGTQCVAFCDEGSCNDPIDVAAGGETTCTVLKKGQVYCWGNNNVGQLGSGAAGESTGTPTAITLPTEDAALRVFVGKENNNHICALTTAKKLYCWGSNGHGKLGLGSGDAGPKEPGQVNVANVDSVALGARHSCVTAMSKLYCWGTNDMQQQGFAGEGSTAPAIVSGQTYSAVSAGFDHTCGISGLTLKCWGRNDEGQVGTSSIESPKPPTTVPTVTGPKDVAAGDGHTCALENSGALKCWGSNSQGQLGTGVAINLGDFPPTMLTMLPGAPSSIAAGRVHTGALIGEEPWLWGRNDEGEVSNASDPMATPEPQKLEGLVNIERIALGFFHSCALSQDHNIYCWGYNGTGQLGNGLKEPMNLPPGVVKFAQ